jgi:hypothetical protein
MDNLPRVLIAEPDSALRAHLRRAAAGRARLDGDSDFLSARAHLLSTPYDWVVTNLRLEAYNGLHLLHLASAAGLSARFLIYADRLDLTLALAAQRAGAFYESRHNVHRVLGEYLRGTLPPEDRRDLTRPDRRRTIFRHGRRCTDPGDGGARARRETTPLISTASRV